MDLLGEDATHHRAPVLERDGSVVRDRGEQRPVVVRERPVPVTDELADPTALPAQRRPYRVSAWAPFWPRDLAVLEDERGAAGAERLHRRLHDRFEGLLEVERVGHRLRDPRERLELDDSALRGLVQPGVLDRLADLRGDGEQQVDLRAAELPRLARA